MKILLCLMEASNEEYNNSNSTIKPEVNKLRGLSVVLVRLYGKGSLVNERMHTEVVVVVVVVW